MPKALYIQRILQSEVRPKSSKRVQTAELSSKTAVLQLTQGTQNDPKTKIGGSEMRKSVEHCAEMVGSGLL